MESCKNVAGSVVRGELKLGRCIKTARKQKGITQKLLSKLMTERGFQGFRQQRICEIEKKGRVYGLELVHVAQILGITVEELMDAREQDLIYNVGDVLTGEGNTLYMVIEEKPEEGYLDVVQCEIESGGVSNCRLSVLDLRESERYERDRSQSTKNAIFLAMAQMIEGEQSRVSETRAVLTRLMAITGVGQ